MHPVVDGVTFYDEVWTAVDEATGAEIPLSELPDDDDEEVVYPTYGQAGFVPLLAEADATEGGLIAVTEDDGYTYYYDPADVIDADEAEESNTADEYVYVDEADATVADDEAEPTPLGNE